MILLIPLLPLFFGFDSLAGTSNIVYLRAGFVQKISCEGRLYLSAVGNDTLVQLEPLPKELGCAVILKPLASRGRTNLILETSAGNITRAIEISSVKPQ